MAFFKEFKEFAVKGNAMELAVGVIIGNAFGKIVTSLVNDIIMPPIGALLGNTDFSRLRVNISEIRTATADATRAVGDWIGAEDEVTVSTVIEPIYWNYGSFIQQCVDFVIIAFCVFLIVKLANRLTHKKAVAEPQATKQEQLLTEIRDLLKKR